MTVIEDEPVRLPHEDRYHRQRLISWWDQKRVQGAKVLVIGAGALGNEILKTLALIGVGRVLIYDMDVIEESNLSRGVLFRTAEQSAYKAMVAAQRMMELNPDVRAVGKAENILSSAGIGVFHWADVVICGLDNRIARLFANRACAWTGRIWVDGAIEGFDGIVRVFDPAHTACYECTMNETDRRHVNDRMSCAMLARDVIATGHVPTTAVTASLIAALQVQEAIKLLHHQPTLMGEGIHVNGLWGDFSRIAYPRREECAGHTHYPSIVPLGYGTNDITMAALLHRAESELGEGAALDFSRDVIVRWECPTPSCGRIEPCGRVLGTVGEAEARCPACGAHRAVIFTSSVTQGDDLDWSLTPAQLGIPTFDCIVARQGIDELRCWLFDGDASYVLGPLTD